MIPETSPETRFANLPPSVKADFRIAAEKHSVTIRWMLSPRQSRNIVAARLDIMRSLRKRGYSYPQIGRVFQMNHATVMHHLKDKPEPKREPVPFPDYSGEWAI